MATDSSHSVTCINGENVVATLTTSFLARLYESTGRAIAVTPASALASVLASVLASASALLRMLKFLVKVL